jgi:hypothetical protein
MTWPGKKGGGYNAPLLCGCREGKVMEEEGGGPGAAPSPPAPRSPGRWGQAEPILRSGLAGGVGEDCLSTERKPRMGD